MDAEMIEPQHSEIAIVGGGPCGALAALRMAHSGHRVVLLEARRADARIADTRSLVLSWASQLRLAEVDAWPDSLPATLIDSVHASQQENGGRTVINAGDTRLPHLGAVVSYAALTRVLDDRLRSAGVTVLWGSRVTAVRSLARYARVDYRGEQGEKSLTCRLAVLAEGGALVDGLPGIRRKKIDYRQGAVLARVVMEHMPPHVAYERFSQYGPLALLPHDGAFMLVWTRAISDAERLQHNPAQLAVELQQALGERLGQVRAVDTTSLFPLSMRLANRLASGRVVLIGNAAQTLHPVAAQGLNLGIRDACGLARLLYGVDDPGEPQVLAAYAASRRLDRSTVIGLTHGLIRVFESRGSMAGRARAFGMGVLDNVPLLRRYFAGNLIFGVGGDQ
jgi:2-octaprenyl-6-methoxyphenol hydroxylase